LKLFYDENTQFFYLLCSQLRQKASGCINKTLLLIKQHITYMNISRYANIDKLVYIFLLARPTNDGLPKISKMKYQNRIPEPGTTISSFADSKKKKKILMPTDPRFF
jgi:hypothetical protein